MPRAPAIDIAIDGMTCASCVSRVEKALASVPGVAKAEVNLATKLARIETADGAARATLPGQLVAAVEDAGYEAAAIEDDRGADEARRRSLQRAEAARRRALAALALSAPFLVGMATEFVGWGAMAAGTAASRARGRRRVRAGGPLLRFGLEVDPLGLGHHGPAGRPRGDGGLWPQPLSLGRLRPERRGRACWRARRRGSPPLFRERGRGDRLRAPGQMAGRARHD